MRFLVLIYFVVFVFVRGFTQSADVIIDQIRNQHLAIDSLAKNANFKRIRFEDEYSQAYGLVVFTSNQQLLKLQVNIGQDLGREEKTFYFDQAGLIFIKKRKITFPRAPRWEEAKSEELGEAEKEVASAQKVETNFFFFRTGEMIHWESDLAELKKDEAYWTMEMKLIQEVENLLKRVE